MAPSKEMSNIEPEICKVNDGKQDRGHSQVFVAICIYLYLTLTLACLNADVKEKTKINKHLLWLHVGLQSSVVELISIGNDWVSCDSDSVSKLWQE